VFSRVAPTGWTRACSSTPRRRRLRRAKADGCHLIRFAVLRVTFERDGSDG
jgi:hypothetical protein